MGVRREARGRPTRAASRDARVRRAWEVGLMGTGGPCAVARGAWGWAWPGRTRRRRGGGSTALGHIRTHFTFSNVLHTAQQESGTKRPSHHESRDARTNAVTSITTHPSASETLAVAPRAIPIGSSGWPRSMRPKPHPSFTSETEIERVDRVIGHRTDRISAMWDCARGRGAPHRAGGGRIIHTYTIIYAVIGC